jgi:hypothetical protein
MRSILTVALVLGLSAISGVSFADDKPVNTVCPKSGKAADGSVVAHVKDKDGKEVAIATCCNNCKGKVEGDAAKYIAAAKANKKAE